MLLRTRRFDEVLTLAKDYHETLPHVAYWFEMQVAFGNGDWAALESLSESMLATPEGSTKIAPLLMASRAAMKLRASERAILVFSALLRCLRNKNKRQTMFCGI